MAVANQIAAIRKSAEKMQAAELEIIGTASVGDVVRQGDLYLVCLASLPDGQPRTDRQLAPGTTQGSRHVVMGECVIRDPADRVSVARAISTAARADVPAELIGPAVECLGDCDLTHPEHGDKRLPAGSVWAVVYQRSFGEEIRRVQD